VQTGDVVRLRDSQKAGEFSGRGGRMRGDSELSSASLRSAWAGLFSFGAHSLRVWKAAGVGGVRRPASGFWAENNRWVLAIGRSKVVVD